MSHLDTPIQHGAELANRSLRNVARSNLVASDGAAFSTETPPQTIN